MTAAVADGIDAVYMLMFPGWETELQANRWHFARRWAQRVPVVLIQPHALAAGPLPPPRPEPRIPNCRVLYVPAWTRAHSYTDAVERQLELVLGDMRAAGVRRPLLWFYNPDLAGLYARLPAALRLFHATENYFDFDDAHGSFLSRMRFALSLSDLVIAVSDGVAEGIRREAPGIALHVVTNGCDFALYSRAASLAAERRAGRAIAVYAGNINSRLDFELVRRCANGFPGILFIFCGPVVGLGWRDRRRWRTLLRRANVRHLGVLDVAALVPLYAAADLGLIPYRGERFIVENGFPLKALEMCAGGLPVISSRMKPLENLASALNVCRDCDAFFHAVGAVRRSKLTAAQVAELRVLCERNDYDRKFAEVADMVSQRASASIVRQIDLSELTVALRAPRAAGIRVLLSAAAARVPARLRARMPRGAARRLRDWLEW